MGNPAIMEIKAADWAEQVEKSSLPVLVDFWAPWCGPCRAIAPVLDQLATELAGKIKICKVNVDDAQDLAAKFNVMSIPTMLVVKGGVVQEQMVGALPKGTLLGKLSRHI
jgi:thioredoxin 1